MIEADEFFIRENTIEDITAEDYDTIGHIIDDVDAFARITYKSIYVIDYYRRNFLYVSNNPLFLCGISPEEVKEMGYDFYIKQVVSEDLRWMLEVNVAGFKFLQNIDRDEVKEYTVSYDFHIINKDSNKKRLINHQITPLKLTQNGKIWLALCSASISSRKESGNIFMTKNNSEESWHYNVQSKKWKKETLPKLKSIEKDVLKLSAMGFTMSDIANEINRSFDTVKAYRKSIFEKLEVDNISEAINRAIINRMI